MFKEMRTAFSMLLLLTVLTGIAYPLLVTGVAVVAFPARANGSLVEEGGVVRGSELIGQQFDDPKYFWSRPSATSPSPYNASASTGSNAGPLNPVLADAIKARVDRVRSFPGGNQPIPVDLVTSSASGLDPHISPAAARFQVERVARARNLDVARVRALVEDHVEDRAFEVLGEPRVNVLQLNLALERMK